MRVELFLEDTKLDTYNDETIRLTDSIQNAKDPNKIFTSFSKQFSLPATIRNNDTFKHYYNFNILNGFDARRRVGAVIKINGVDFRKGFFQLNSVKLKLNKPTSYKVVFTGELAELKDVIRDDKLSDLFTLNDFNHAYNETIAINGFNNFLDVAANGNTSVNNTDGALCYPFVTTTKRYGYSNGLKEVDENGNLTATPVTFRELKPALRLNNIITAIGEQYDFSFEGDFFTSEAFKDLFMWFHRDKGRITSGDEFKVLIRYFDWVLGSGSDVYPSDGILQVRNDDGLISQGGKSINQKWLLQYDIIISGTGLFNYKIIDDLTGEILAEQDGVTGDNDTTSVNLTLELTTQGIEDYQPSLTVSTTDTGITELDSDFILTKEVTTDGSTTQQTGNYDWLFGPKLRVEDVIMPDQAPDMLIIDFLTSIFKTFNLTAEIGETNGVSKQILIKPLDDFYANGIDRDITNFVDISETEVSRFQPFSRIVFDYEDPSTFLIKQRNNVVGDKFGKLEVDLSEEVTNGRAYTGGDYSTNIGFEKMIFERLRDVTSNNLTDILYGRFVDEKEEPTVGKPLIFYAKRQATAQSITINTTTVTNYIRPSNVSPLETQTINFGAEVDEFTLSLNRNSLFENFYKSYIQRVFNILSRIYMTKALLPLDVILNYSLSDKFVINGRRFMINKIDLNINKREAKIELLNDI